MKRRWRLSIALLGALACGGWAVIAAPGTWRMSPDPTVDRGETVVLLHGMGRTRLSMLELGQALRKDGYRVVLYGYPSTRRNIAVHGAKFAKFLAAEVFPGASAGSVHLAGHSLGAIVIRQALGVDPPSAVGRIVMYAPPNQGSRTADRLSRWWICRWLLRPLPELSTAPDAYVHRVPVPQVDIGIIVGRDDGKVDADLSHLPGNTEADHRIVPAYHSFLMNRADVQAATCRFLRRETMGKQDRQ